MTLESLKIGLGPVFFKKNITLFQSTVNSSILENILFYVDFAKKEIEKSKIEKAIKHSEDIFEVCEKNSIKIVSINDKEYPKSLLEIKDPPPTLYYKGNLENISKVITVIGTREPNKTGQIIAERISTYYRSHGFSICNGLAQGIDTNSIKVEDNYHTNTIGIMGGGLNYLNTKTILKNVAENVSKILDNDGLVISEFPPNKKEDTFSVIKSCRIQAGLAHGLILIQSSLSGGSKYTIKTFTELDRVLGVVNPVPQDYDNETYGANKSLIENKLNGLAKLTEIKSDKISLKKIFTIKTKENYSDFERLVENQIIKPKKMSSLYN